MKAVFLDRDGTLIVDPPDLRVDRIDKIKLFPETMRALKLLAELDYRVFIISNQAGIAEGRITMHQFETINNYFIDMIEPTGIHIAKTYVCPHNEAADCICRKPKPGLLLQAAREFGIDLAESWMIGDRKTDIQAGKRAGTKTILVETGNIPVTSAEADYKAADLLETVQYIATNQ